MHLGFDAAKLTKPLVEAVEQLVELGETRWHTGELVATTGGDLDLGEGLLEGLRERDVVVAAPLLADLIDLRLRRIDDRVDFALALAVSELDDPRPRFDELPQQGALGDDRRVVADVGRRRHRLDQVVEVCRAPHPLQRPPLGHLVGDGDRVDGLAAREQVDDRAIDDLVGWPIEVVGLQPLGRLGYGVLGQQHPPEHRLLGVHILRREPIDLGAVWGAIGTEVQLRDRHRTAASPHSP